MYKLLEMVTVRGSIFFMANKKLSVPEMSLAFPVCYDAIVDKSESGIKIIG